MRSLLRVLRERRDQNVIRGPRFHDLLRRERTRSDRTGSPFSVVQFSLAGPARRRDLSHVLALISRSKRDTDEIGWLRNEPSVLLLDTAAEGARGFSDRVRRLYYQESLDTSAPTLTSRWFTYPAAAEANGASVDSADGADRQSGSRVGDLSLPSAELHRALPSIFAPHTSVSRRVVDIIGASLLLVLALPLIAVCAILIKATSPGPVFFRQMRAGLGGRLFPFYKLRTMVPDAESKKAGLSGGNQQGGPVFKMDRDPRVTPVGRWLRKLSIDELPQLWNVVLGDMTLVGPRPPTPDEVVQYERWQYRRLEATGGLTCIWQVYGRSRVGFEEWVRMDIRYIEHRTVLQDAQLLLSTLPAVLAAKGAH